MYSIRIPLKFIARNSHKYTGEIACEFFLAILIV